MSELLLREDEHRLRSATQAYWADAATWPLPECAREYVTVPVRTLCDKSLLQAELEYVLSQDETRELVSLAPDVLVLMVGLSIEPLLISVAAFKPREILLVLSNKYPDETGSEDGACYGGLVQECIEYLAEKGILPAAPTFLPSADDKRVPGYVLKDDDPVSVFRSLMQSLKNVPKAVIDVTGGKKSMVTGAFMFAAHSGFPVSYVDFDYDAYCPTSRRPYGYKCRVGALPNPYESFRLREWEQVRELYTSYRFRTALDLLVGSSGRTERHSIMCSLATCLPEAMPAVERMRRILEFYEIWDSGDLRRANGLYDVISSNPQIGRFDPPTAVGVLGPVWYEAEEDSAQLKRRPSGFHGDPKWVKAYAVDEIARIDRLIRYSEDYRSAFVRAGGLNEVLVLARLPGLLQPLDTGVGSSLHETRRDFLDRLGRPLTLRPSIRCIFDMLREGKGGKVTIRSLDVDKGKTDDGSAKRTFRCIPRAPMKPWNTCQGNVFGDWKAGFGSLVDLRNEVVHRCLSVPSTWATSALDFVRANLESHLEDWGNDEVGVFEVKTDAISWRDLCRVTGVDDWLAPGLVS